MLNYLVCSFVVQDSPYDFCDIATLKKKFKTRHILQIHYRETSISLWRHCQRTKTWKIYTNIPGSLENFISSWPQKISIHTILIDTITTLILMILKRPVFFQALTVKYLRPTLFSYFWGPAENWWDKNYKSNAFQSMFMQLWSRNNLDQLDR